MNKTAKRLLCVFFIFLPVLAFAQVGVRVTEQTGGFSYCPPLGWNVSEFPGLKYNVVYGQDEDGFNVNIVFVDEAFDGNLREYADASIAQLSAFFDEYKLLDRQAFRTNSGINGECISINNVQRGYLLRQVFYVLPMLQNRYIVITCSVPESASAKYLSVFEESVKTFEWVR